MLLKKKKKKKQAKFTSNDNYAQKGLLRGKEKKEPHPK